MFPSVAYQGSPSDAQRVALQRFGEGASERDYPLHFVGREDILGLLGRRISDFNQGLISGPEARIITGAPGVGKTSLLKRLMVDVHDRKCIPILIDGSSLNSPVRFVEEFIQGLSRRLLDISIVRKKTTHDGAKMVVLKSKQSWEKVKGSANRRLASEESVWSVCQSLLKKKYKNTKIVLMVDETQVIDTSQGSNTIVRELQRGPGATGGFHIFPIFAGLLNTEDVLEKVGISREAFFAQQLDALSADECAEAVDHFLRRNDMGLDSLFSADDRRKVAELFSVASEGWPRHLHCYMTELAKRIATDFTRSPSATKLDLDAVLDDGHRSRIRYSRRRVEHAGLPFFALGALQELASKNDDGQSWMLRDIHASCVNHAGNEVDKIDLEQNVIPKAVHAGVLQHVGPGDAYAFSIPSLHTYIASGRDEDRTLALMRDDLEKRLNAVQTIDRADEADKHQGR